MKTIYQSLRDKKRLVIYLLKLSTRGEIVQTNLRKLIQDIYDETGEIFAKTDFGVMFESFLVVDGDDICNLIDKNSGCGEGYNVKTGICSSSLHKPSVPILLPANVDQHPEDFNPFPGNIFTVIGVLPTVKPMPKLKKQVLVKFRRDFGEVSMRNHWPQSIKFERYQVMDEYNNGANCGIVDIIK